MMNRTVVARMARLIALMKQLRGGECVHGYTTIWLSQYGWYRIDARGNVDARFEPPQERLAFSTAARGEVDYNLNLAEPLPCVVQVLQQAPDTAALSRSLPSSVRMG